MLLEKGSHSKAGRGILEGGRGMGGK